MTTAEELTVAARRIHESARAVGAALASVELYTEPAITRAVQAEQNLYGRIEAEFGLLTSTEAGKRLGSRSRAPRNLAAAAHHGKTLLGLRRGNQVLYPGFQFSPDGQPLPAIRRLHEVAEANDWSETGLIQWLCGPTTYFGGDRPVDHLGTDPDRVVAAAAADLAISW